MKIFQNEKYLKMIATDCVFECKGNKEFRYRYNFCGNDNAGWENIEKKVVVISDRYGVCPLFYYSRNDYFIVSSSLPCLLKNIDKKVALDREALACFFDLGWFVGEDTPFMDIKAMPPNATLTWQAGKISLDSKPISMPPQKMTADQAIDEFYARFSKAVANCLTDKPFALPLSGGADSRLLLAELCRLNRPPKETITAGRQDAPEDSDSFIARLVSKRFNVPHTLVQGNRKHTFLNQIQKTLMTNYAALEHEWAIPIIEYMVHKDYQAVYDGIGPDVFFDNSWREPYWLRLLDSDRIEDMIEDIHQYFIHRQGLCKQTHLKNPAYSADIVLENIKQKFCEYLDLPKPVQSFFFFNRTRRCVAMIPMGIYSALPNVFCPYLDPVLMDWVIAADIVDYPETDIRKEVYRRYFPEYSDIPFAENKTQKVPTKKLRTASDAVYNLFYSTYFFAKKEPALLGWWLNKTLHRKHLDKRKLLHLMLIKNAVSQSL